MDQNLKNYAQATAISVLGSSSATEMRDTLLLAMRNLKNDGKKVEEIDEFLNEVGRTNIVIGAQVTQKSKENHQVALEIIKSLKK